VILIAVFAIMGFRAAPTMLPALFHRRPVRFLQTAKAWRGWVILLRIIARIAVLEMFHRRLAM
jgi:hypothetical protein